MRILFTSHYALPHLGGIEVAIDAVARELSARGHEVTHLASGARRAGEESPGGERAVPYRVVRVPALNPLEDRLGVPYPLFSPTLLPSIRREVARADVVHAHGYLYMPTLPALALARRRRAARVLTEHVGWVGYDARALDAAARAAVATVGRASARMAQVLVALNEHVERELAALAPGRHIARIHNGVDPERYRPATAAERQDLRRELGWDDRPHALFVGRLVARKGLDIAVAAASRAGVELVVVGPGRPPGADLSGARLMGALPPERVAELYRAADAFVLPSRGEGFPVTAQEALASGLPVVLAEDRGYGPYLDGAGPAVRLTPPTADSVAAALTELVADPGRHEEAARAAVAHARRHFSWSRAADEHERLYARCLDS